VHGPLSNFNPPSLSLPLPFPLSPPSHLYKLSLILLPSLSPPLISLSCPSPSIYKRGRSKREKREKDKRGKVREERMRVGLYR